MNFAEYKMTLPPRDVFDFRTLSHEDMLSFCANQARLTPLELELFVRLEQMMAARDHVIEEMTEGDCVGCPNVANLIPPSDVSGQITLVPEEQKQWQ